MPERWEGVRRSVASSSATRTPGTPVSKPCSLAPSPVYKQKSHLLGARDRGRRTSGHKAFCFLDETVRWGEIMTWGWVVSMCMGALVHAGASPHMMPRQRKNPLKGTRSMYYSLMPSSKLPNTRYINTAIGSALSVYDPYPMLLGYAQHPH